MLTEELVVGEFYEHKRKRCKLLAINKLPGDRVTLDIAFGRNLDQTKTLSNYYNNTHYVYDLRQTWQEFCDQKKANKAANEKRQQAREDIRAISKKSCAKLNFQEFTRTGKIKMEIEVWPSHMPALADALIAMQEEVRSKKNKKASKTNKEDHTGALERLFSDS